MGKRTKSFKVFGKKKESQIAKFEDFVDPNDPKFVSPLLVWYYFGIENIVLLLGSIGAAGHGCIGVLLFMLLGDTIDSASSAIAPSTSAIINAAVKIRTGAWVGVIISDLAEKMAYVAVGAFVACVLHFFFFHMAHGRVGTKLKIAYFNSLLNQEIGYFDMKRTGHLINTMTESMELIQETYTNKLGDLVMSVTQVVFACIMALVSYWKLALVMMSFLPLIFILLGITGFCMTIFQKFINRINGQAASISNEVVSSMRTIRSMDGEEREKKRFYQKLLEIHKVYFGKAAVAAALVPIAIFINYADIAFGFWYGGTLFVKGELTIGAMLKVYGFFLMSVVGMANAMKIVPEFGKASQNIKDLLKVIKRTPILNNSGGVHPEKIVGHIEFKDVTFSYPTRPDVQVLKKFNLVIEPGQAVALVGASGSGKSTIVGLIEKYYKADSGTITLDGVDLDTIDPRWIHRNIGIVTQEPTLFAASIKDNILYAVQQSGRSVTDQDVIDAAIAANAHDFIMALPDGYNTMLGERGVSMSGGQKQRIAIARAMIQDPKLLLLDEATSALDTQSESIVQEALDKLMVGRTSIIIAHRLSTVINSDVIVVMNKGQIKEKGTHNELVNIPNGYYRSLAARQMLLSGGPSTSSVSDSSDSESDSSDDEGEDRVQIEVVTK